MRRMAITTRTVEEAATVILETLAKYPKVKGLRKALFASVCGASYLSAREVRAQMKEKVKT